MQVFIQKTGPTSYAESAVGRGGLLPRGQEGRTGTALTAMQAGKTAPRPAGRGRAARGDNFFQRFDCFQPFVSGTAGCKRKGGEKARGVNAKR